MEAATSAQRHAEAKVRATAYKPKAYEVPTEPGCAGDCTLPVPAPPIESFVSRPPAPESERRWILLMSIVAAGYAVITMTRKA